MKRYTIISLVAVLLMSFVAAQAAQYVDPLADRGIIPVTTPAKHPIIPGESMTTGLPQAGAYLPILINIDNTLGAWPPWGLAQADILYEMPIHGYNLTRLVALFAYEHPQQAGPVRSGRVMHAQLQQEWGAAWVYFGTQSVKGSSVREYLRQQQSAGLPVLPSIDGTVSSGGKFFSNMQGYQNPHNHSIQMDALVQALEDQQFEGRPFLFADQALVDGLEAKQVHLDYPSDTSYSKSSFHYDADQGHYLRFRDGKPYDVKEVPGKALAFTNVIIQWTELTFNGQASAPMLTLLGQGNAEIFQNGRYIPGYWVRENALARTVFYDQNGEEIKLQRGKTFINITSPKAVTLSFQ